MKFVLEVDVPTGDAAAELGHILRYWASSLAHYDLGPGNGAPIYDSGHAQIGRWHIVGGRAAEEVEEAFDDFEAYEAGSADPDAEELAEAEAAAEAEGEAEAEAEELAEAEAAYAAGQYAGQPYANGAEGYYA